MDLEKENKRLQAQLERTLVQLGNKEDLLDKVQNLYIASRAEIDQAHAEILNKNEDLEKLTNSLLKIQQELEKDIGRRIQTEAELRAEKEKADKATRLKDMFVTLVTHDLRTPISNVIVMLSLVSEGNKKKYDAKTKKRFIDLTLTNAKALIRFIDELLDINRLKTGRIRPDKRYFKPQYMVTEIFAQVS